MSTTPEAKTIAPTCRLVRAGEPYQGKQGLMYAPAISAETVGAQGVHMQLLTIPPGGRAKAHKHASHETAIYMLSGVSAMWYGDQLEQQNRGGGGRFGGGSGAGSGGGGGSRRGGGGGRPQR